MTDDSRLLAALEIIQARGAIGERSLAEAIAHSDRFVELIPADSESVVDLGSGGGLPALVVAWRRPDLIVTMIERRATRADLLRRATISLGMGERTRVLDMDASVVAGSASGGFDVVTSRSFGDIATTARFVDSLLGPGGIALISEPPTDRSSAWTAVLAAHPCLVEGGVHQGIRVFHRV